MKIGKEKILNKELLLVIFFIFLGGNLFSQEVMRFEFEEKAIEYFCKNIDSIIPDLEKSKIRFSGKSKGAPSDVYNIADCIGEINLLKDSIPNNSSLDSLGKVLITFSFEEIKTGKNCFKAPNRICNTFNKSIYTLHLFNSIEYKGNTFIELYLLNKKLRGYIIVLKFNNQYNKSISHFVKSRIY